jgi:hypothetical protein
MASPRPWHAHPAVVGAALFCCFPVGLYLVWAKTPWTPKTKALVTGIWFALLVFGTVQRPTYSTLRPTTPRVEAPLAGVPAAVLPSTPKPPTPQAPPPLVDGSAFATAEPRLLLPTTVEGFRITGAGDRPDGGSVAADYESTTGDGLTLQVLALVGSEPLPEIGRGIEGAKIGAHDGVVIEDRKAKSVSVLWPSGGWEFTVDVLYPKSSSRALARKAAIAVAPVLASQADRYLNGTPRPPKADRDAHVAEIEKAVYEYESGRAATAKRAADGQAAKLLQQRVNAYAKVLSRAGIDRSAILRVDVNGMDQNELVITVNPGFLTMDRALQLESAKNLWLLWAKINTPTDLDASGIKLVTPTGTVVAASGLLGGSTVHLE